MLPFGNMSDAAPGFSLELSSDLREMRDWVHEFAASVIRPAAAEWDEREEVPWPILEEAAKIGLYSLDFYAQQYFEPSGLGVPIAFEELFWGDAGIGLSLTPCRWCRTERLSRSGSGCRRCSASPGT